MTERDHNEAYEKIYYKSSDSEDEEPDEEPEQPLQQVIIVDQKNLDENNDEYEII
jgi:hypothetical protein